MTWDTSQQLIRILGYSIGSYFLGKGVMDGEMGQQLMGGLMSLSAFGWWLVVEKNKSK